MQDYKHIRYESEKRKDETKRSKKTSIIILILLAVLIGAGVYLQKHPFVAEKIEKIVEEHKPTQEVIPPKRFAFYDILARGEHGFVGRVRFRGRGQVGHRLGQRYPSFG